MKKLVLIGLGAFALGLIAEKKFAITNKVPGLSSL